MEKEHVSVRRGISWSPGGVRKPHQDIDSPSTECNASWEKSFKGQPSLSPNTNQMGHRTNLTRSASLSEKELKEARVRSQIIAAQLTIPSNSNSRGVQLFNRRKQRVNAFTLESSGKGSEKDKADNVKASPSSNILTWAERRSEEKNRELNCKNSATKALWSPTGSAYRVGDIMEEPGESFHEAEDVKDSVIHERHFLPVNEKEELDEEVKIREEEEEKDEVLKELEDKVEDGFTPESDNGHPVRLAQAQGKERINGGYMEPGPSRKLLNGCHSNSDPDNISVSTSKQATTIMNRTARPFLSPTTVQFPDANCPVMDIPPAPSYATPSLPDFTAPHPVAFSPLPPPPSYPTPPLPAVTKQPPQTYTSPPPPVSPVMTPTSPLASQFHPAAPAVSQYVSPNPSAPQHGQHMVPRPSTFVPQPIGERKPISPIKSGILEEGAVRRGTRKSMFTFKEKPVVAPNPELLSLVQGADERKKHLHRPVPELAAEEELLELGAEASNFLAKEEERAEEASAPEWASCLKSSRTQVRAEHRPEQTLTNASGKGAELFAKRQSRMEKYVVDNQNTGQMRSPSPTMSLPPSWVYPSNMPGRVKAIAKNSDMCSQLSQTLQAQQSIRKKPSEKAPPPAPVPEEPPLENGCTKIEMDLSRHQPYQINSSLFILNPVKDPMSSLPKAAPPPKPLISSQTFPRQTSLPNISPPNFISQTGHRPAQCLSPQLPLSSTGGMDYPSNHGTARGPGHPRLSSPMSAFSPGRVSTPRSGVQAPRPTFSAKKAGIEPQAKKEPSPATTPSQTPTPTRTPSLNRRYNNPEGPAIGVRSSPASDLLTSRPSSAITSSRPSVTSPVSSRWGSRCQSPMVSQSSQPSMLSPISTTRLSQTSTATSPISPPWGSRCQSPSISQTSQSCPTAKPIYTSTATSRVSPTRESRCMSPIASNLDSKANHRLLAKNIINAAKRKNSPSPGALSSHSLPISPLGSSHHGYDCGKPALSPFQSRALGAQSPTFTSPPPTPTQRICSPVRLYNTRSLTDSDASVESEDSGMRSPGLRSYNTCPRGWGGSLRVKRGSISTDL
ncbi:synaptopodin 2-like protein [Lampris incognitus]|uniref:synaptopodin 2-like protein n=1 Tax=Lampris incognitus TaxID=2546036 RepID=UPI0024B59FCB|nr:synaptopodin 2-like protein [Lampris incognitus]